MIVPVWIVCLGGDEARVCGDFPGAWAEFCAKYPKGNRIYRADIEIPDASDATAISVKAEEVK